MSSLSLELGDLAAVLKRMGVVKPARLLQSYVSLDDTLHVGAGLGPLRVAAAVGLCANGDGGVEIDIRFRGLAGLFGIARRAVESALEKALKPYEMHIGLANAQNGNLVLCVTGVAFDDVRVAGGALEVRFHMAPAGF